MSRTAAEILEEARQLIPNEQEWLLRSLEDDAFVASQREVGEPEPGYEEWFRASVEEALADDSPDIPHEDVVKEMAETLGASRASTHPPSARKFTCPSAA